VEVIDVTAPLLVEELQRQQAQQGGRGRDHLGAGVAGLTDELVELNPGEQWQEQEQAGQARRGAVAWRQAADAAVGDGRALGLCRRSRGGRGAPARACAEKGGDCPDAQAARNWPTCWRKASKLRSKRWAASFWRHT